MTTQLAVRLPVRYSFSVLMYFWKNLDQISDCQIVKHWRKARRGEIRLLATVWLKMDILWPKAGQKLWGQPSQLLRYQASILNEILIFILIVSTPTLL
jgi:hypothetical protein